MTTIDTLVRDIMKVPYSKSYARERITEAKAEWEREAQVHIATAVLMAKTEGMFDNGDLFIKRAPIEQALINILGYETVRAIKDAATVAQLTGPSTTKETK